jgi:type IV pilus assembly protein PilV
MRTCTATTAIRGTKGFTLLEVLAALSLLSVGMLGIATLYLESLRIGRLALHRTQAVTLAADLADRIRANRDPAGAYACGDPCRPDAGGNALATADLAGWLENVAAQLPGGTGAITFTSATNGVPARYTVALRWSAGGTPHPHSFQLRLEL